MPRRIASLAFVLALALPTASLGQDAAAEVSKIRAAYAEVKKRIAVAESDGEAAKGAGIVHNSYRVNGRDHSWPAVGIYRVTYDFWYEWGSEQPYPDRLRLAVVSGEVSARNTYLEFFYDAGGRLIFHYARRPGPDGKIIQRRLYFAAGKVIRVQIDDRVHDGGGMTEGDKGLAEDAQRQAKSIKAFFEAGLKMPVDMPSPP
jgi:hypothetical protein